MICARCTSEIESDSSFCRRCGAPTGERERHSPRRLQRLPSEAKIGGVCAGIAAYFSMDATLVRLAWVILTIVPGFIVGGLLAYGVAWLVLPAADTETLRARLSRRLARSASDRKIAGVCGGVADYLGVDSTLVRIAAVVLAIYPGAVICGVVLYLVAWFVMPGQSEERFTPVVTTP